MRQDITSNLASFMGGLGAGVLITYLFDPELGSYRRRQLGRTASKSVKSTGGALSSTLHSVRDRASEYGNVSKLARRGLRSSLRGSTGGITKRLGNLALMGASYSGVSSGMRHGLSGIRESMSGIRENIPSLRKGTENLSEIRQEAATRLRELLRDRRSQRLARQSGISQTLTAIGCVALGLGVMYMLDPVAGRRRRALVRDKFQSGIRQMGGSFEKTGRDIWNRATGTIAEMKGRMAREQVSDDVLAQRVKSEIGRCVSNPGAIQVQATHGRITLSGPVLAHEVDGLLKCAWSTRGVTELLNQLDIHQHEENIPALQGARQRSSEMEPASTSIPNTPEANRI